jgi:hypothetical protein
MSCPFFPGALISECENYSEGEHHPHFQADCDFCGCHEYLMFAGECSEGEYHGYCCRDCFWSFHPACVKCTDIGCELCGTLIWPEGDEPYCQSCFINRLNISA